MLEPAAFLDSQDPAGINNPIVLVLFFTPVKQKATFVPTSQLVAELKIKKRNPLCSDVWF